MSVHEEEMVIIGGGPAGYTSAIYAARAGRNPLLLSGPQPGGQLMITSDVENYPGYADPVQGPSMGIVDLMADVVDFADTAALVAELDLIISVDTSTAHLAAAMGKPVWLLSRYSGCWRWLTDRADSPWYPSLRLYRQDRPRDWAGVIAQVVKDLGSAVTTGKPPPERDCA